MFYSTMSTLEKNTGLVSSDEEGDIYCLTAPPAGGAVYDAQQADNNAADSLPDQETDSNKVDQVRPIQTRSKDCVAVTWVHLHCSVSRTLGQLFCVAAAVRELDGLLRSWLWYTESSGDRQVSLSSWTSS